LHEDDVFFAVEDRRQLCLATRHCANDTFAFLVLPTHPLGRAFCQEDIRS